MSSIKNTNAYDLAKLDFNAPGIKEYWCLANVKRIFGMVRVNMGPSADAAGKYIDEFNQEKFRVGDVLILKKKNKMFRPSNWDVQDGRNYGHIGVLTEIGDNYYIMNDGNASFPRLKVLKKNIRPNIDGVITAEKMVELGATKITLEDIILTQILDMAMEFINMDRKQIFQTTDEDYKKSPTVGDVKDLIEIMALRLEKNNGKFPDRVIVKK